MMCKNNYYCRGYSPCMPIYPRQNCIINVINPPPVQPQPFLSSYIEAVGSTQTVPPDTDIIFDTDASVIDTAGNAISVNDDGTVFTITETGLYHVEWSVNVLTSDVPRILGILENGLPTSAISHETNNGNVSSGALINVTQSDIPLTVSLHNFGGNMVIADNDNAEGTAASIRILRFADGPE